MNLLCLILGVWISNEGTSIRCLAKTWSWRDDATKSVELPDESQIFFLDVEGRGEFGEDYDIVSENNVVLKVAINLFRVRKWLCFRFLFPRLYFGM